MRTTLGLGVVMAALVCGATLAQTQTAVTPEAMLGAALHQERVTGNLQAAIDGYRKVLASDQVPRSVAAQAQYHVGLCYERLGDQQARQAFEAVVRDYADEVALVRQAQARLAGLGPAETGQALAIRRIFQERYGWEIESLGDDARSGNVSPDGRSWVKVNTAAKETYSLAIRDLGTGEERQVAVSGARKAIFNGPGVPVYSADGTRLAYVFAGGSFVEGPSYDLRVVGVDGQNERRLAELGTSSARASAWSPDGEWIAVTRGNQILLVSTKDRETRQLVSTGRTPRVGGFSPDGRFLVYQVQDSDEATSDGGVFVLSTDGQRKVQLAGSVSDDRPAWTPDGRAVVFHGVRSGSQGLWAVPVEDGRPFGPPELLWSHGGAISLKGLDRQGRFYYAVTDPTFGSSLVDLDPETLSATSSPRLLADTLPGSTWGASWSPNGKYVAYFRAPDARSGTSVVIRTMATGDERELPHRVAVGVGYQTPQWFPDGRSFMVPDGSSVKRFPVDGADPEVLVEWTGATSLSTPVLSRDGRAIYGRLKPCPPRTDCEQRLVRFDIATRETTDLYRTAALSPYLAGLWLSPDGTRLAFTSSTGTFSSDEREQTLNVISTDGGEPTASHAWRGPSKPVWLVHAWTADGRNLLFDIRGDDGDRLWAVPADGGTPRPLGIRGRDIQGVEVSPDGRHLAFTQAGFSSALWRIDHLLTQNRGSNIR